MINEVQLGIQCKAKHRGSYFHQNYTNTLTAVRK